MNNAVIGGAAFGGAAIIALSILAPFGLLSSSARERAPVTDMPPPANASEGMMAYDVGIPPMSEPKVFFANIGDGATVTSPVTLAFGMAGMNVMAAGEVVEGTGHHHLLINRPLDEIALDEPLPAEETLIHFGDGSTSVTLDLVPGTYRLQLLAANGNHVPHDPPVASAPITVTVVETMPAPTPLFATN